MKLKNIDQYINEAKEINENVILSKPFAVVRKGGSIGNNEKMTVPGKGKIVDTFDTKEEASEYVKRRNKQLTPGEKSYYGMKYSVLVLTDNIRKKVNESNEIEITEETILESENGITEEDFLNESLEANQQALARWKKELKGSTSDTGKVIAQKWIEHYKELVSKDKAKGAKVTEEKEEINEAKTKSQAMINRKIMDLKDCVKMIEKCNDKLYDPGVKDALGATLTNMDKHISDIRQIKTAATKAE